MQVTQASSLAPAGTAEPGITEHQLFSLLEAYPDAIAIHRRGTLLYANRAGLTLVGARGPEDVVGRSVLDFVHPESRELVVKRIQASAAGQPGSLAAERFIRLDGMPIDVEVVSLPIDLAGEPATQLIVRDVSELRRIERENERLAREASAIDEGHQFTQEALALAEDAAGLGVWDWKVGSNELRWTTGLEPLHGMAPGTFRGTFEHFLEAVLEQDRPTLLSAIDAAVRGRDDFEARFRVRAQDGAERWVLGKGRVFRDEAGNATRMVGIGLDITEQARVEMVLAEREKFIRVVTGLLPANVAYFDRDERYRFVNDTYRAWFGVEPQSLIGKSAREFMGQKAYAAVSPALQRAFAGEPSEIEMDILHPQGGRRYIHARYVPDFDEGGEVRGVVALINDVSDAYRAAAERESRSRGKEVLAEVASALAQDLPPVEMATRAAGILAEALGAAVAIDLAEDGRSRRAVAASGPSEADAALLPGAREAAGLAGQVQQTIAGPGGERRLLVAAIQDGQKVRGTVSALREAAFDPVEAELLYEVAIRMSGALDRAALLSRLRVALAAKDDFIGFTTHELKTPLTVLLGFADVLRRRAGEMEPETIKEVSAMLVEEARKLEEIIGNMLLLARAERGAEDEPVLLRRVVSKVIQGRPWKHGANAVRLTAEGEARMVMAPVGWIEHVVENLLSNAEKYSEPGSPIEVHVATAPDSPWITVEVLDRGRGISEEQARDVFEPFFRANPGETGVPGVGLGLTVCRKLVDRLGGEIWIRPREGGGCVAGFRLPIAEGLE